MLGKREGKFNWIIGNYKWLDRSQRKDLWFLSVGSARDFTRRRKLWTSYFASEEYVKLDKNINKGRKGLRFIHSRIAEKDGCRCYPFSCYPSLSYLLSQKIGKICCFLERYLVLILFLWISFSSFHVGSFLVHRNPILNRIIKVAVVWDFMKYQKWKNFSPQFGVAFVAVLYFSFHSRLPVVERLDIPWIEFLLNIWITWILFLLDIWITWIKQQIN